MTGETATAADGTHHTGMYSRVVNNKMTICIIRSSMLLII